MNYSNEPLRYHLGFANSYQKYKLQFKQDFEFGPVRVIAFPEDGEDIENIFSHSGDAELNLSPYIGIDNSGKLFWDTNGHQPVDSLKVISVEPLGLEGQPHSKFIRISYKVESVVHRHDLNLDDFLDVVECYDETSQQFRLRLGVKPTRTKRSIVLCFDGTSNHFGNQNTNVIKLVELLKKNDPSKQMVYYQAGIGTYSHSGLKTRVGLAIAKCFDTATAQ
ncbi:hypothetical protein RSOLAG1IB_06179 [Rhizoctonia solani AG-1 IB]|uniref:T6SS Phospholipase effector Tle1-like catalytic domain-containing protein n=1 Tax=Thanatephorus cucumeris (strain AG1-IB / isolate 7/3/14) TaxID=1108050 RepID=A0A0B7FAH4_THACB|nr:hypothetical protein RSOLAG1IB_06179 [Rhizoctonia solani AG-1 IB]